MAILKTIAIRISLFNKKLPLRIPCINRFLTQIHKSSRCYSAVYRSNHPEYWTATKSQLVPFFYALSCNKITQTKCIWKWHLQNGGHFVSDLMCSYRLNQDGGDTVGDTPRCVALTDGFSMSTHICVIITVEVNFLSTWWRRQVEAFFCVTGPLCGEFTGHRWIPLTKGQ